MIRRVPFLRGVGDVLVVATFFAIVPERPATADGPETARRGYTIPLLDLSRQKDRQVVVDREQGQYLGHPTTVLLEDGRTMLAVYPRGHGRGAIILKRSTDGGRTWSDRLPTPENWRFIRLRRAPNCNVESAATLSIRTSSRATPATSA